MYRQYKYLTYFIISFMIMVSCIDNETVTTSKSEIIFVSGVDKYDTRVSQDGSQWAIGDQIGVYSFASGGTTIAHFSNVPYTAQSASTATVFDAVGTAITYQKDKSSIDFMAYHPYISTLSNDVYPIDLANQVSSLVEHDLLYAQSNNNGSGHKEGNISLGFKHQLSKIIINLVDEETGAVLTPDASGMIIKGMNTTASFDLKTGILSNENTPKSINPYMNGSSIEAILLPFVVNDNHEVVITVDDNKYLWKISDKFNNLQVQSGYSYTFKVTVTTSEILDVELVKFDNSSINPWGDGGNDVQKPTEPEESEDLDNYDIPDDYTIITLTSGTNGSIRTAIQESTAEKVAIKLGTGTYTETSTINVPANVKSLLIVGEVGSTKPIINTKTFISFSNGDLDLVHLFNVELAGVSVGDDYFCNHNNSTKTGAIGRLTFEHCIVHDYRGVIRIRTDIQIGTYQIKNSIFHRIGGYNLLHIDNASAHAPLIELSKSTFYHLGSRGIYLNKQSNTSSVTIDQCTFHQGPYYSIVQFSSEGGTLNFTRNIIGAAFDITDTSVVNNPNARGISVISGGTIESNTGNYYTNNTTWQDTPIGIDCGISYTELFANPTELDFKQSKVSAGDPRWY